MYSASVKFSAAIANESRKFPSNNVSKLERKQDSEEQMLIGAEFWWAKLLGMRQSNVSNEWLEMKR